VVRHQAAVALTVSLIVLYLDQVSKAWAWRNVADVHVDTGGGLLAGSSMTGWLRDAVIGSVIDVGAAALVVLIGVVLVRSRRSPLTLFGGALTLGGWASNLGDRLGLHDLTAAGSERGAVDFLPWGDRLWNLADLVILLGLALLVLAALTAPLRRPS
jgi:lipoprotein signal peptidase